MIRMYASNQYQRYAGSEKSLLDSGNQDQVNFRKSQVSENFTENTADTDFSKSKLREKDIIIARLKKELANVRLENVS